ncbi:MULTISPECIES: LysR family transcriptional regulator [Stappiaceae]|uniref:Cyn operon transcriptional activator n=1 Tax=Roseibium aggregatum TaxID=187304 RepID=A0A0M6Y323_9HYPH|nr:MULTISPECIES: LysR family transcriptional regulator [Stappiaceae]QFT65724.1 HTH-type transcriptional regulator CynR [Labrenzia sp. THAF35]CTQ44496.1 Cyn operon transcriptional activator [Roseibium aggregatum]
MLHSRVLRYIDEVARRGSIRAAGDRLNVAPSAINKHILQLEEDIGEPLFERLPRGLRLTPAGEVLVAHVRKTIREYSQVEADIRGMKALQSGEVIIATMSGLAGGIVPKTAASLGARHPRLKITVRVMFAHDIANAVLDGQADIGLAFNLPPVAQLETLWTMNTRLGAVLSPEHPLARQDSISLTACQPYPLIFADRSMLIHGIVADAFVAAGLEVEPAYLANSIEAMKCLAGSGDGIAFLSRFDIAEEQRNGSLTFVPIREQTFGKNVLSLVQRDKPSHSLAATMLAEDLVRALQACSKSG